MRSNLVTYQCNIVNDPEEIQLEFDYGAKPEENVTIFKHIAPVTANDSGYCQTTTISLDDLILFVEKAQDSLIDIAMENEYYESRSYSRSSSGQKV